MNYYMGMDHGTTAVSFQILNEDKEDVGYFKLNRDKLSKGEISFKDIIYEYIDPKDITLLAMTYAMGDNISKITPIELVKNRGIKSINGAGKVTGGGSKVYEDIKSLNIPSVLIPGLHRECEFLDDRFRAAYSHCASAEKISLSYYAYLKTGWKNMIIADVSSNSVCVLIEDGEIKGAMDACIGALGFIHGPIDLNMIRDIDSNKKSANECFSHAGISKIASVNTNINNVKKEIINKAVSGDKDGLLAIDTLVMTVIMEIFGLYGIMDNKLDGIVLTGSGGSMTDPINISGMITEKVGAIAPVHILNDRSGAIGSSYIAYDIGEENYEYIMGVPVVKK